MKSKITFLLILAIFAASCKKTTDVNVTVSTSGKLTYKLVDDGGKGIPNVKVSLFDNINSYYNTSVLLDTRSTDQNGVADFGDLNPSTYLVVPDSPMVNNIKYFFREYVQVITGNTKQRDVKVSDFSATLNLNVKLYSTGLALKNAGVLLIPSNKFVYSTSIANLSGIAEFKGVTTDNGAATFKVPSTKAYTIVIYNMSTNIVSTTYTYFSLDKGATVNLSMITYSF